MQPILVRTADVPAQPWRNGGGVTRELLALPEGGDWRVRISVADVASNGPFSTFAGVDRWFAVLDGAGVELTIDGNARRVTADDDALAFAGAAGDALPPDRRADARLEPDAARRRRRARAHRSGRDVATGRARLRPLCDRPRRMRARAAATSTRSGARACALLVARRAGCARLRRQRLVAARRARRARR